jgi:hypothetical protein
MGEAIGYALRNGHALARFAEAGSLTDRLGGIRLTPTRRSVSRSERWA